MTLFSFEAPIAHLRDLDPYQDFFFGLSFLLDNKEYETYFKEQCASGRIVYLDNSFNETMRPALPTDMAALYWKYNPTAVASPDADWWDLTMLADAFWELSHRIPTENILGIYRTDEERAFFEKNSKGPMAVSYWWADTVTPGHLTGVHSLGLVDLDMVKQYQPATLDTSQMVKLALRGETFEEYEAAGGKRRFNVTRADKEAQHERIGRAWDFFNLRLTDAQLELTIHNIQAFKESVGDGRTASASTSSKS